jgi:simple sugar transport system permease protein
MRTRLGLIQLVAVIASVILSLSISALLLVSIGRNPLEVAQVIWDGSFSDLNRLAGVFNFWIPFTLASLGLVVTFRAGLWNIGVEGQMMFGAIFASGVALFVNAPSIVTIPLAIISAMVGGLLWAVVVGLLKTRLGVHEIFGGVALNALANVFTNFLVSNLWSPAGGNALDTGPFPPHALLPEFSPTFTTNITLIILVLLSFIVLTVALWGSRWGLELKATGKNARSALLLGVPTERISLSAFAICGILAGIGGAYRVLFTFDTLRPLVSGGIGFLAILVVLLVNHQVILVPLITFIFAAVMFGSTRLKIRMQLDSSLAEVLQGLLVLLVMLSSGLRKRIESMRQAG